ncbi:MAG: FMN-binding negative transcriptional regulator [Flaviaesturariibacter sp.]|nr:FMN-binding negative transcriptional regulator [Flaviaesturariibacter sp.]
MYNLPYYKEKDQHKVLEFIHQHPFAFMAGCSEDGKPVASQIPVFIEEREGKLYLAGHIMRQTDHHKAFEKNPAVLCIFTGPHTYVSATWYDNPSQASTWNYMSVHVKGTLQFLGEQGLIEVLRKTSLHFEDNNTASPTSFDNLTADYTSKLMKAIVAFEIEVQEIDTVFKLSQNRDQKSYKNIVEKLQNADADGKAIAAEMKAREESLFS